VLKSEGSSGTLAKELGTSVLISDYGEKGPFKKPRFIGTARDHTHLLINQSGFETANPGSTKLQSSILDLKATGINRSSHISVLTD